MKQVLFVVVLATLVLAVFVQGAMADSVPGPTHTVQRGETLASIARRYCTTWQELYNLNAPPLTNPNQLYPGMTLRVVNRCGGGGWSGGGQWGGVYDRGPRLHAQGYLHGNAYMVVRGDTAYSIARRFGISTYALGQANGINPWHIYAGQRLIITGLDGGGHWPPGTCQSYGGYNCPPGPAPQPTVWPIPITPVAPPTLSDFTYTTGQCVITATDTEPYYDQPGGVAVGVFPATAAYTATRGAKRHGGQQWYEIDLVPFGLVWAPISSVTSLSPGCIW